VGDAFDPADLTLAALSAPLLRPNGHPWGLPEEQELIPAIGQLARHLRDTRAHQHVAASYARRGDGSIAGRSLDSQISSARS
jgi:hypothetical protein